MTAYDVLWEQRAWDILISMMVINISESDATTEVMTTDFLHGVRNTNSGLDQNGNTNMNGNGIINVNKKMNDNTNKNLDKIKIRK